MPHRSWLFRLNDIIESIRKIQDYTKNLSYDGFVRDGKTKDAVLTSFMIIGEAVNHTPAAIIDNYPEHCMASLEIS